MYLSLPVTDTRYNEVYPPASDDSDAINQKEQETKKTPKRGKKRTKINRVKVSTYERNIPMAPSLVTIQGLYEEQGTGPHPNLRRKHTTDISRLNEGKINPPRLMPSLNSSRRNRRFGYKIVDPFAAEKATIEERRMAKEAAAMRKTTRATNHGRRGKESVRAKRGRGRARTMGSAANLHLPQSFVITDPLQAGSLCSDEMSEEFVRYLKKQEKKDNKKKRPDTKEEPSNVDRRGGRGAGATSNATETKSAKSFIIEDGIVDTVAQIPVECQKARYEPETSRFEMEKPKIWKIDVTEENCRSIPKTFKKLDELDSLSHRRLELPQGDRFQDNLLTDNFVKMQEHQFVEQVHEAAQDAFRAPTLNEVASQPWIPNDNLNHVGPNDMGYHYVAQDDDAQDHLMGYKEQYYQNPQEDAYPYYEQGYPNRYCRHSSPEVLTANVPEWQHQHWPHVHQHHHGVNDAYHQILMSQANQQPPPSYEPFTLVPPQPQMQRPYVHRALPAPERTNSVEDNGESEDDLGIYNVNFFGAVFFCVFLAISVMSLMSNPVIQHKMVEIFGPGVAGPLGLPGTSSYSYPADYYQSYDSQERWPHDISDQKAPKRYPSYYPEWARE